ncbi:MAG: hypothetical protein ACT4P3_17000 [Betaproteobacteria bacterium]
MRTLLLIAGFAAFPVQADLYRWIDPESGSVKYSSVAPPWYGDAALLGRAPAVEVLPYQPSGIPQARSDERSSSVSAMEARWRAFLQAFSGLASAGDFERAGRALQEQLGAYQALAAELDRIDPGGAARRRAQETSVMEKLQKGLEAQLSPKPPVQR